MRWVRAHRACMISTFIVSTIFLSSYLLYHYEVGNVRFSGHGWVRALYFAILIPHVTLAGVIVPLALRTMWLALPVQFHPHRRIARWTLPLWRYAAVTAVLADRRP